MLIVYLLLLFILLFFSAFFSGSETALFSLDRLKVQEICVQNKNKGNLISQLLKNPRKLLIGILIGNTLVNVTASVIAGSLMVYIFGDSGMVLFMAILLMTFLLLVLGEITPKMYAIMHNISLSVRVARWINLFLTLIAPVRKALRFLTDSLLPVNTPANESLNVSLSEEEFRTLVKITEDEGIIKEKEGEILKNILELSDTTVENVMTPRTELIALDTDMEKKEIIKMSRQGKHRRLPVYKESIDKIIGKIRVKKLLLDMPESIETIVEPVLFVPEEKKISELLREFREKKENMAVVVDEYGGTSGIVTLEDLIEEIVGEIIDEFDERETLCFKMGHHKYRIRGKMRVDELNELLKANLPLDTGETINGFLSAKLGRVPKKQEHVKHENLNFYISKSSDTKILELILELDEEKNNKELLD